MRRHFIPLLLGLLISGCQDDPAIVPAPVILDSPAEVIAALEAAYRSRDIEALERLLAHKADDGADFAFFSGRSAERPRRQWGRDTELALHRRMFRPDDTQGDGNPVPKEMWPLTIEIAFEPREEFSENTEFRPDDSQGGLDPSRWRTLGALYSSEAFLAMSGDDDLEVLDPTYFVVIEDRVKRPGSDGRFFLLYWFDLREGETIEVADTVSWTELKLIYRQ